MNICIFFEGTGQGVEGKATNVTRLHDAAAEYDGQLLFLEPGPGTRFGAYLSGKVAGADWRAAFGSARRWFEANYTTLPAVGLETRVYLFGFSRGALIARHFAAWLDRLGVPVAYMGLWDTVDSTMGLDVSEECPRNVRKARHAVARDEARRFFDYVPLRDGAGGRVSGGRVVEMLFPGSHSDVGGLYDDNHVVADVALAWVAAGAKAAGMRFKRGVKLAQRKVDVSRAVLHDSHALVSNLWGGLGSAIRNLAGPRLHPAWGK